MAEGKQKPGVMIYFDSIRPALTRLNDEQCGSLFLSSNAVFRAVF